MDPAAPQELTAEELDATILTRLKQTGVDLDVLDVLETCQ